VHYVNQKILTAVNLVNTVSKFLTIASFVTTVGYKQFLTKYVIMFYRTDSMQHSTS